MIRKRLSRTESQQITRKRLLKSAAEVFARDGFAAAAVDEITERAGFSRGAFYANFKNKDDLFLALLEEHMNRITEGVKSIAESKVESRVKLVQLKKMYLEGVHNKEMCLLMTELFLYSIRQQKVKEKLNKLNQVYLNTISSLINAVFEGSKSSLAPRELTISLFSLGQGLSLQHLSDHKFISKSDCHEILNYAFDQFVTSK